MPFAGLFGLGYDMNFSFLHYIYGSVYYFVPAVLVIYRVFGYIMCRCGCAQIINLISFQFLKDAMDHSTRQQTSLRG